MGVLYNIVFIVFAFFYLPLFLFKGKRRKGLSLRFGIYPERLIRTLRGAKNIWVHAVSVGEVMAAAPLIGMIAERHPGYRVVITTVTETGNIAAEKIKNDTDVVLFLPFDITFVIRRVIRYIMPSALIIVETELWPNLISQAAACGIKVFLVNGRISDRSVGRYGLIKPLLKKFFSRITLLLMQTESQKQRVISLGAEPSKVKVTANMKFDNDYPEDAFGTDRRRLKESLGIDNDAALFIAGSTHPGEEEVILSSYVKLKKRFSTLRLLIAPRHIERTQELEKLAPHYGLKAFRVSYAAESRLRLPAEGILILDTIGRLRSLYGIADIVFIGGSLVRKGGQNMIEPAFFAKPVLLGPHTYNFRDIVEILLKSKAVSIIKDEDSLTESVTGLLQDASLRRSLGRNAKAAVESNRGAAADTLGLIENEGIFS